MENASNRSIYFSQLLFTLSAEQSGLDPSPLPPLLSAGTPAYSNINGTAKLLSKIMKKKTVNYSIGILS